MSLYLIPPDKEAVFKNDYEAEYEMEGGIKVEVSFIHGDIVTYEQNHDEDYVISIDSHAALTVTEEIFSILFNSLPQGKRYYTYRDLLGEVYEGRVLSIYDFDFKTIVQVAAFKNETGYIFSPVLSLGASRTLVYHECIYRLEDYGSGWIAVNKGDDKRIKL